MQEELNKLLLDKIFEKIPETVNPIDYLMKTLDISRKTVYRRKKGELPFTFEEIYILSNELDFSIDELVAKGNVSQAIFSQKTDALFNPKETFTLMLEKYLDFYRKGKDAKSFDGIFTMNRILPIYIFDSTYLFRFFYYQWIHQGYNVPLNFSYTNMIFPPEVLNLGRQVWEYARYARNTTIIVDEMIFKNIYSDIEYYYKRELMRKEDFINLRNELLSYIKILEKIVLTGMNAYDSKYTIYLSKVSIESNSAYFELDNEIESSFWVFGVSPIYTNNSAVYTSHRKWLNSLKKYSTLISQSNEMLQSEFFNEQYNFILESAEKLLK